MGKTGQYKYVPIGMKQFEFVFTSRRGHKNPEVGLPRTQSILILVYVKVRKTNTRRKIVN